MFNFSCIACGHEFNDQDSFFEYKLDEYTQMVNPTVTGIPICPMCYPDDWKAATSHEKYNVWRRK